MTAQAPETLIYKGKSLDLCAQPLYDYLRTIRKSRRPNFGYTSTACWRGYIGTWRIDDGRLYLIDIRGLLRTEAGVVEANISTAMPWLKPPVHATWFTGELRCPEGRLQDYVHAGFASLYERDRIFWITNGDVEAEWLRINPPPPLVYRISPDGTRTRKDRLAAMAYDVEDPFPPDEEPVGYKIWGIPPKDVQDDDEDDGYVLQAMTLLPPQFDRV